MANTRFKTHHGILATSNSRVEGDLTVTGNLQVTGVFSAASQTSGDMIPETDQFSLGTASKRWNLYGFTANLASTLTANGATTLANTLTVTGAATFQNTASVQGTASFQNTVTITGQANLSANLNVSGSETVTGTLSVTGNSSLTNGILTVNTNSGTNANTVAISSANVNIDAGVLFVDSVNNRVGINNTAPGVALRVTGALDVSTSANVQGSANVAGALGVAGQLSITNASVTHAISGNVAFDSSTLFVDSVNNRVGINNTTPTAALEVAGDIRASANLTGTNINGTNFVSNSSGLYHTGTVNAVSFTTSKTISNTTGFYPTSNNTPLGNTTARWDLFASTLSLAGAIVTGNSTANVITGNNYVSANSTTLTLTGTVTVTANSTAIVGSGTTFTTQISVGDVLRFSSCNDIYYTVTARTSDTAMTVLPMPDAGIAGAGLTVEKKRVATVNTAGLFLFGSNQAILPSQTEANSSIGNTSARWNVFGNAGDFSGSVAVANGLTVTGSTTTTTDFRIGTIGAGNGFIANTSTIAIGNSTVNTVLTPTSFSTTLFNATQGFTSGTIGAASGFAANSTVVAVGNSTSNVVLSATGASINGGVVNSTGGFYTGTVNATSNGAVILSGFITVGNTSVNAQITPTRWSISNVSSNSSGIFFTGTSQTISPGSNTSSATIGAADARWGAVYAQQGNFSDALSAVDLNLSGSANVATQIKIGTIGLQSGMLANTTTIVVGNSSVSLSINSTSFSAANIVATNRLLSGTIGVGTSGFEASNSSIKVGTSTVNVIIDSAGIALNGGGTITTNSGNVLVGTINSTSNGVLITPSSITVGNSTVNAQLTPSGLSTSSLSTNGLDITGAVNAVTYRVYTTGPTISFEANATMVSTITEVRSPTFRYSNGTAFVFEANTSGFYHNNGTVNAASIRTSILVGNTTGLYPTTNATPLGSTTARWAVVGSTGSFSGAVTGAGLVTTTTLTANGSTGTSGQMLYSAGAGNAYWGPAPTSTTSITLTTTTTATRYIPTVASTTGTTATLYTNTGLYAVGNRLYASELQATSDENLKENIVTIDAALNKVSMMRGVTFNFKEDGRKSCGVVAQEMEQIIPEIVSTSPETGYKHVNYDAIIGVLIEAIKELKQEINELKNGN